MFMYTKEYGTVSMNDECMHGIGLQGASSALLSHLCGVALTMPQTS